MQTRKIAYAVMGALMITSVLAGCGKKENTTTAGNEGNSQVSQTQESSSRAKKNQLVRIMIYLRIKRIFLQDLQHKYLRDIIKLEVQEK